MADDIDPNDWAPGQPPPWLAAYGDPLQLQTLPGELGKASWVDPLGGKPAPAPAPTPTPAPPTKPPMSTLGPRGRDMLASPGAPVGDEVPLSGMPPSRLSPEEEAQIEIDPSATARLSPEEEAQIEIDKPKPKPFVPPWLAQEQPAPASTGAPLQADAISGVGPVAAAAPQGETPEQALARITMDPNASLDDRQKAFAGLSPEQRTNIVNTADPKQLAAIASASMAPEELATIAVRHQQAQFHEQSAAQLELARKADEDARRNWQTYQATIQKANADTEALSAEAQAISKTKIDTSEHGVGHFIASVLTSAIGGAMSQYTGGRNLALEELDKRTQDRIDAQKTDIDNRWKGVGFKRNLIAEHVQQTGDMYRAEEAYRIGTLDRALGELQTKAQDYDPQGTTGLKIVGQIQQIQAQRSASLQAYNKQSIENGLKQAQTLEALASAAKTQQETRGLQLKQAGMGGAAKVKAEDYVSPEELVSIKATTGIEFAPGTTRKEVNARLGTTKNAQETAKVTQETASGGNASIVSKPHGDFAPITDKAGNPIRIAPEVAKEINASNTGAQNVVTGLNDVKRLLEEGPSSFDRDKWGEIQARIGQSMAAMTEYFGAKFSKREEEAIKDITNLDFDGYVKRIKDRGPAIASIGGIIDTMKQAVDTKNSAILHTPVSGMLSDVSSAPKPKPTVVDKLASDLATPADPETRRSVNQMTRGEVIARFLTNEEQQRLNHNDQIELAYKRGLRLEQEQGPQGQGPTSVTERAKQLDQLAAFANARIKNEMGRWYVVDENGKDISDVPPADTQETGEALVAKYRDTARAHIAKLAADAEDETVRDRAGALVQGFTLQNVGTPEEVR